MKRMLSLLAGSILMAGAARAMPPPSFVLAAVELAPMTNAGPSWSAATNINGKACRVLAPNRTGAVRLPAWWTGMRPPSNTPAVCAWVVFLDATTTPVRVSAFAALPGSVELHRIGGTGDGAWHTAIVPLPWDMVARVPGTDQMELSFASDAAAVPVAGVRAVPGNAAVDEARWAAETRAWVARVQAGKRKTATLPPAQETDLKQTEGVVAVPFVRAWNDLIQCNSAPQSNELTAPIRVRLALNEIRPAQFGVYAMEDLSEARVELAPEGLVAAGGAKLHADVELFTAEYAVLADNTFRPARLWPAYPVAIADRHAQLFWLNVETHAETAKPGVYQGRVLIQVTGVARTVSRSLPLEVTVLPIRLPTMKEAGLTMGGCMNGMPPAHEMQFLSRHNHNGMSFFTYGLGIDQMQRGPKGELVIDFTALDDLMMRAGEAGIERFVYFLGGDPYGFPDTLHLERELYRNVLHGGTNSMADRLELLRKTAADPDHVPPEVKPLYKEWVRQFMAHAREKNWPEPLLSPYDEAPKWNEKQNDVEIYYYTNRLTGYEVVARPYVRDLERWLAQQKAAGNDPVHICHGGAGPWLKPHFKETCALIHEAWPGARIYASIHHAADGLVFLEDVDVFNSNAISMDPQLGDKVRAGGKVFWQYSWCGDTWTPDDARYIYGFYFAAFDSRGSLAWAYNCGPRFDTSSGEPSVYGFTTPYSVARAPVFEGVREAWNDRRYIEGARQLARAKGLDAKLRKVLDEQFLLAAPSRVPGDYASMGEFNQRVKNPHALENMRQRVVASMLSCQTASP